MSETEFIEMAKSYGIRAGHIVPYGYYKDESYRTMHLAGEYIGKITDIIVFGHPEESGRAFYMEPREHEFPTEMNTILLENMTKEKFENLLTYKFSSILLAERLTQLKQFVNDVETLNDKLGWGCEP